MVWFAGVDVDEVITADPRHLPMGTIGRLITPTVTDDTPLQSDRNSSGKQGVQNTIAPTGATLVPLGDLVLRQLQITPWRLALQTGLIERSTNPDYPLETGVVSMSIAIQNEQPLPCDTPIGYRSIWASNKLPLLLETVVAFRIDRASDKHPLLLETVLGFGHDWTSNKLLLVLETVLGFKVIRASNEQPPPSRDRPCLRHATAVETKSPLARGRRSLET
ncbi:hypothetical protein D8Y22_05440 [Salinadaptatus halalkaliphilus]|uniref:Uncharacterized protein n=1 Tax=Salinadaptatus halalkaliphilus TaxID=2419781 RepID=A0A4S3TT99_9EURY|nr:hypothetical protein D8Y22_05440 [Salinadaptatus halalkaliphilus]